MTEILIFIKLRRNKASLVLEHLKIVEIFVNKRLTWQKVKSRLKT